MEKEERRRIRKERLSKINKEIKEVDIEDVYYPYRPWQDDFKQYWRKKEETVFKISHSPWSIFVEDYCLLGDKVLDDIDNHVLAKWAIETFTKAKKNIDNVHIKNLRRGNQSLKSAARLIGLVKSIKEHGYCEGEYNSDDNLINVVNSYIAPDGNMGYKLLWGNRRASVCAGMGIKKIKVRCWEHY